ncbi:MAG: S9 family peptidase [Granulosicoccus sp.]|nr:S9 family peptidase [Granulosicoccus sp.]
MIKPKPDIIPRTVLFGNPDRTGVRVSRDGSQISYLASHNDVLNIWVAPIDKPDAARLVTHEQKRDVAGYTWAYNNRDLLYVTDNEGDENWRIHRVDLEDDSITLFTPAEGVHAQIRLVSPLFPDTILVGLNQRDARFHDLFELNVRTGALSLLMQNEEFDGFVIDDNFNVRIASKVRLDGGNDFYKRIGSNSDGEWELSESIDQMDSMTTFPVGMDAAGEKVYWFDSRGRNTSALVAVDIASGEKAELASDPKSDPYDVLADTQTGVVQAVSFNYLKEEWTVLDAQVKPDLEYLTVLSEGELRIVSRSHDNNIWMVVFELDNGPLRYYLYNRAERDARFMFSNRSEFDDLPFASMHPVVIPSRDGLDLVSYYTLPVWTHDTSNQNELVVPEEPLPMILLVHGGPYGRDEWGFDSMHQLIANRGYAVLSVNFRASTGFGKAFVNAGDGEWAGKMHDDLIDSVNWAVEKGIAKKDKVAIVGASYGGYAALVGLTFTPDVFACAIDIVGPSNLETLLKNPPEYWKPSIDMLYARIGNPNTEKGAALLKERSPLTHANRIQRPLLIGQGANDQRVKRAESDQIVDVMREKGIPVTYALFPDEGHGFDRMPNRLLFLALAEVFLAKHLGNDRYESMPQDYGNASMQLLEGDIPVLP